MRRNVIRTRTFVLMGPDGTPLVAEIHSRVTAEEAAAAAATGDAGPITPGELLPGVEVDVQVGDLSNEAEAEAIQEAIDSGKLERMPEHATAAERPYFSAN